MNINARMRKYYVGLIILMVIAVASLVYAISQAGPAKADRATDKAVENVGSKLDEYITNKGTIPGSLSTAGIKDMPSTVTYTATSTSYKICFDYKTASNGFDASWLSLLGGGFNASQSSPMQTDHSYFDSTVEFMHKKGKNCQTVQPAGLYSNYQNPYSNTNLQ